jgi:hypothetical protein
MTLDDSCGDLRGRLGSTGAANRSLYWQDGHAQDDRKAAASA